MAPFLSVCTPVVQAMPVQGFPPAARGTTPAAALRQQPGVTVTRIPACRCRR